MADFTRALVVALIMFSVFTGLQIIDDQSLTSIAQNTNTTLYQKAGYFWLWGATLNALVPTIRYELPGGNYILPVNDIPFFDGTDLIIMSLILIPSTWIAGRYWKMSDIWGKLKIAGIVLLIVLAAFLLTKYILYQLYLWASAQMGMTAEQAIQIREQYLLNLQEVSGIMYLIAIVGGLAIFASLRKK